MNIKRGVLHWSGISLLEEVKAVRVAEVGAAHVRAAALVMRGAQKENCIVGEL